MKIPDSTSLARVVPVGSTPNSYGSGASEVAQGLSDAGNYAYKIGQAEAAYQKSAAESKLLIS